MADAPRVAGVDVDGVLGDQVTPLLPLIEERTGIRLTFDDIIEWNIPIGESDFKTEMAAAMDPRFVEEMPLHEGASEMMDRLNDDWTILVITTRAPHLVEATKRWLERHSLPFDKVISAAGNEKAFHGTDVLIDDYTENVKHFPTASDGWAVLVDRPWNRNREALHPWLDDRLIVATDLTLIPGLVRHP